MRGQPRATTASRPARTRVAYRGMGSNGVVSRAASRDTDSALDVSRDVESSDEVERGVRPRRREHLAWRPNAWAVFAAATLVQSCSGLAYSFGVYSDDLRTVYPSQSAVDLLGTAKDVGTYFGVAGGVLYDAFGARATLLAGALIHLAGYLGVWATLTRQPGFVDPPLWRTALIVAVAANGNSLFDTAALLPSMDNFPLERGVVVGILKAYLGLSSAIFAQLYATFIPRDGPTAAKDPTAAFVVLVAVVGAAVAVAAAPFFPGAEDARDARNVGRRDARTVVDSTGPPERDEHDRVPVLVSSSSFSSPSSSSRDRRVAFGRLTAAVVALVAIVSSAAALDDPSLIGANVRVPSWAGPTLTAATCVALAAPWIILRRGGNLRLFAAKKEREEERSSAEEERHRVEEERHRVEGERYQYRYRAGTNTFRRDDDDLEDPLLPPRYADESADESADEFAVVDPGPPPLLGCSTHGLTLGESLRNAEQWMLFVTICFSSGAAMTLVNNVDATATAVGCGSSAATALVSVFSVCNCLGRLCGGEASEAAHRAGVPRPFFLVLAQLAVAVGMLAPVVAPNPAGVFVAVAIVGGALGAHWVVVPTMCCEMFGDDAVGAVYGWLSVSPMIGSYALSTAVFGRMYDAADPIAAAGGNACVGARCFAGAFVVCAAASGAAVALTAWLGRRTAHVYEYHRGKVNAGERSPRGRRSRGEPEGALPLGER